MSLRSFGSSRAAATLLLSLAAFVVLVYNLANEGGSGGGRGETFVVPSSATDSLPLVELPSTATLSAPRPDLLLFNPVPKTGSSSMAAAMEVLADRNGFTYLKMGDRPGNRSRQFGKEDQVKFADLLMSLETPAAVNRHVHFVDFPSVGAANDTDGRNPVYINFLRDPLERFRSRFHYGRQRKMKSKYYFRQLYPDAEPGAVAGFKKSQMEEWRKKDINACIMDLQDRECNFRQGDIVDHSIAYFCGQHRYCAEYGSTRAVAEAIANIERHYTLVGILEMKSESDSLLEALVPRFFGGLSALEPITRNGLKSEKSALEPESERRLRQTLRGEYDLYLFARQRLHNQLRELVETRRQGDDDEEEEE